MDREEPSGYDDIDDHDEDVDDVTLLLSRQQRRKSRYRCRIDALKLEEEQAARERT
jgi:hypothetical protein